jgi:hypothetical protein
LKRLEILPVATLLVLVYALVGGILVIVSAVAHVDPVGRGIIGRGIIGHAKTRTTRR